MSEQLAMTESLSFPQTKAFSFQGGVDLHRIQSLLNKAISTTSMSSPSSPAYSNLFRVSSPSEPSSTSTIASDLSEDVSQYINSGGPLPNPDHFSPLKELVGTALFVFIDGMDDGYTLIDDDLYYVFSKFGSVSSVSVTPEGTSATVQFPLSSQSRAAVEALNYKSLTSGGFLRVQPFFYGGQHQKQTGIIRKYTCRFDIGIDNDKEFHVARRIIGQKGSNMKRIVKQSGYDAKLRLRGRGSGFLEGNHKQESSEPLHLCISCKDWAGYRAAILQVETLLEQIYDEFKFFQNSRGQWTPEDLRVTCIEHPLMYSHQHVTTPGPADTISNSSEDSPVRRIVRDPFSDPPPGAPSVEEVEKLIEMRNEARRVCDFQTADKIRDLLRSRGIGLMDEPGGRGRGTEVTTWRYWRT
jgi:hypothetical protein